MYNRILIFDMLNQFLRQYVAQPRLSTNGQPVGGITGTLYSIQKIVAETKPDLIVLCWDGQGGSARRKATNKNYKEGRKPLNIKNFNRSCESLDEGQELQNRIWQQGRLIEYLNLFPVVQFMVEHLEADDVIAYVCNLSSLPSTQFVVVSSDKDFYQLCNERTIVMRPVQKEIMNVNRVLSEFNIHPANFAIARAIAGDTSDNLIGVKGAGLPTVAKRLPMLAEATNKTLQNVFDYCSCVASEKTKVSFYQHVLDAKEKIEENYRLMQLYAPSLSPDVQQMIQRTLWSPPLQLQKTEFQKMCMEDGIGTMELSSLFQYFQKMRIVAHE